MYRLFVACCYPFFLSLHFVVANFHFALFIIIIIINIYIYIFFFFFFFRGSC